MIWIYLAIRNVVRHRANSLLTALAIAIGIWLIVGVSAYIESVHRAYLEDLVHARVGYLQIHKSGYFEHVETRPLAYSFKDSQELRRKILAIPGVKGLMPSIRFFALFSVPQSDGSMLQSKILIEGQEREGAKNVLPFLERWIQHGRMFATEAMGEIVLHTSVATPFHLTYSAEINISEELKPALMSIGYDGVLRGILANPVGEITDASGGDRAFALVSLKTAQKLTGLENEVLSYVLDIEEPKEMEIIQKRISTVLNDGFEVKRWDDFVPFMRENFLIEDIGKDIGLTIFFLIAAIGAINAMMMTVMERTREIGTMMAMGITGSRLASLFLLEGAIIGTCGAALGVIAGAVTVALLGSSGVVISSSSRGLPLIAWPTISVVFLIKCFLLGLIGTMLASLWPAWRASKLNPAEALQS